MVKNRLTRSNDMLNVKDMTVEQKIGHVMCACYVYKQEGDFEFVTVTELLSRRGTPPQPSVSYAQG